MIMVTARIKARIIQETMTEYLVELERTRCQAGMGMLGEPVVTTKELVRLRIPPSKRTGHIQSQGEGIDLIPYKLAASRKEVAYPEHDLVPFILESLETGEDVSLIRIAPMW